MGKYFAVVAALALSLSLFGCGQKKTDMELSQELLSMDQMSAVSTNMTATSTLPEESKTTIRDVEPAVAAGLEPLPSGGPFKPGARDIQTALKNSGYYTGTVDGKIGPMTKEAIEEFQKANGLEADGKVGPKTWDALGKYLVAAAPVSAPVKASKKRN